MADKYILIGQTPVPARDLLEWAMWFEHADRRVGYTLVGEYEVSTVFLSIDHNWIPNFPPLLFETMVCNNSGFWVADDPLLALGSRTSTWLEAEAEHREAVETIVKATGAEPLDVPREFDPMPHGTIQ